jgi:DNA-binding SARP family transcriptional activator
LTFDGRPPQPDLLWRKNLALLVYLARSPKRRRTRQHLMGLLWPEKSETSARQSLREAIRILRKALGKNGLSTEHDQVQLVEGAVHLDTEDFEALEQAADWPAIAAAVQGEFLEGFGVPDASAFEDWLAAERDTWRRRALDALVAGAGSALARGQAGTAADWARRALHLDPGSDAAARMAMTALAVEGDRAAALECYERLAGRLAEVGAEPEAETRVLAERVKAERTWRLSGEVPTEPERGAESRRAPLVGRDREIQALLETGCATEADRGSLVCIILGDSGLGKSRLLDEVLSRARLGGAAVAAVRAVEGDLETPWSGMVGLARGGLLDAAGIAGASPAALASLAAAAPEWADRFAATTVEPAPLSTAFTEAVAAAAGEQPVLLAVDNAQWLDRESLLALLATLRDESTVPVTLLLAAQDTPPRAELESIRSQLGRDLHGVTVHVQPLGPESLRELTRWAIPAYGGDEVDRLARRVEVDSAGIPLLAVELLHAVALGLDLGTISGVWPEPHKTLDQTLPAELPDGVVAAIRVGFRRLSKPAQQVLAAAAVLGDRVEPAQLERATGVANETLSLALDELEWQRWLVVEPRGYSFVARIVRDVIGRDMLTEGQRRRVVERARP